MTRFVKVSLSIVALLLVTLLVFTGCGKSKALTAADEAKAAVVTATEELEAALAKKADAATLAEKVEALTKAINAAETAASDGDAALNAALEEAKASLKKNAEDIVAALDTEISKALAEDRTVVNAKLALLQNVVENINSALGTDYIKVEDYVEFSTTVAYYVYELETKWAEINSYASLYDGGVIPDELERAYTTAHVLLYRATSMSVVNQALAQFETAMANNPNPIDKIYYEHVLPYMNGDLDAPECNAGELYAYVAGKYGLASPEAAKLIADYYGKGNLVLVSLELWRKEITADMIDIAGRYLVYPEEETYGQDDYNDILAIEGDGVNQGSRAKFTAAVAECQSSFGTGSANALSVPASYDANVDRMNILKGSTDVVAGAKDAAATVNGMTLSAEELASKFTNETLDQATIDKVANWKKAYDAWVRTFLPELQETATDIAKARYAANAALVADSKAGLYGEDGVIAKLTAIAKPYLEDAAELYMNIVAENFYDADGDLDVTKVTYASGAVIDKAMAGWLEWMDTYKIDLDLALVFEAGQKSPREVGLEILEIKNTYTTLVAAAATSWDALDHDAIDALVAGTDKVTLYDKNVNAALNWIKIYAMADGTVTWNTKVTENETEVDAFVLITETKSVTFSKTYYDNLVELKDVLDTIIEYKQGKAVELNAALDKIAHTAKLSEYEAGIIATVEALNAVYVSGEHTDLPEGVTKDQVAYDDSKTTDNDDLDIIIYYTEASTSMFEAALTRYNNLKDLKDAVAHKLAILNTLTVAKNYPHFTDDAAKTSYKNAIVALENAVNAFADLNGDKETYMTEADAAIKAAKIIVAHDDVCVAENAVKSHTLNALPSYFADVTSKEGYTAKKNILAAAIEAYKALDAEGNTFDISSAEEALAKAKDILAKEELFDRYLTLYANATTKVNGTDADAQGKIDEIYNEYQKIVNNYDLAEITVANDNLNYSNFKAVVNAVLTEHGFDTIA